MQRQDFTFELPEALIAQRPEESRSASRMLVVGRTDGLLSDSSIADLPNFLRPNDLLVFNDTRVIPARMFGKKETGGRIEILVERLQSERMVLAQIRSSKSPKAGSRVFVGDEPIEVAGRQDNLFVLEALNSDWDVIMRRDGHMPLPPYITREDEQADHERYQTVYAKRDGAVAAPTAGLHFDHDLLARLATGGVNTAYVTLHVGAGTFTPVRVDDIREHKMHAEWVEVSQDVCDQIAQTRQAGGRVIAVGTTSLRCLESAWSDGSVRPFKGDTDIFIYPGVPVHSIDGLLTNFHLPESTLLMLVSALAGKDTIMDAYRHAVDNQYRFFSYGDAMLII